MKKTKIICLIVLVISAGLVAMNFIHYNITHKDEIYAHRHPDEIWIESYREIERNRSGVLFNDFYTTKDEYELLSEVCNEEINLIKNKGDIDANIKTDVINTDEEFVDNVKNDNTQSFKVNPNTLVGANSIYFNDMILTRYINETGDFAVVSSVFTDENKSRSNIVVYKQNDMKNMPEELKKRVAGVPVENSGINSKITMESDFVNIIVNCISSSLKYGLDSKINKDTNKILGYFTVDGKEEILKIRSELNISNDTNLNNIISIAGKSNMYKDVKDRIYMQFNLEDESTENTVSFIVKLNSNLKIFDVDMI